MKAKVALLVAIVLGVVAAWGVHKYINKVEQRAQDTLKLTAVVAAKERIMRDKPITFNQLTQKEISEDAVTRQHVLWRDADTLVREKLNRTVEAGELILRTFQQEVERQLTTTLPPGELALTLRVDDVSGVAGTLRPGSHVDIYATLPVPKAGERGGGDVVTRRILANVSVLAIDNRTALQQANLNPYGRGIQPYSTVTVAATPEESALLIFVQGQGQLTLSLRNVTDIVEPGDTVPEVSIQNVLTLAEQLDRARKQRQANALGGGN